MTQALNSDALRKSCKSISIWSDHHIKVSIESYVEKNKQEKVHKHKVSAGLTSSYSNVVNLSQFASNSLSLRSQVDKSNECPSINSSLNNSLRPRTKEKRKKRKILTSNQATNDSYNKSSFHISNISKELEASQ